jgi:hypothetical protein
MSHIFRLGLINFQFKYFRVLKKKTAHTKCVRWHYVCNGDLLYVLSILRQYSVDWRKDW